MRSFGRRSTTEEGKGHLTVLNTLQKISTVGMSRDDWLKERKKGIGGSDAAAVIGLSPWASPFSVWMNKTGREDDQEDNERLRQGRDLEDYVARRWCEATGKNVRRVNAILINPDYPWAIADIDRAVTGEDAILECKTTSILQLKKYKNGEYPVQYYVQCQHYMAVTGCKKAYLAVLVLQKEFLMYEIERDEDEIRSLMEQEKEFWEEHVVKDVAPAPDGMEATSEGILDMYPEGDPEEEVDITSETGELDEYFAIDRTIKELTARKDQIKQALQLYLGTATTGVSGEYKITWRNKTRQSFDFKRFRDDHPELDLDEYIKVTNTREFRATSVAARG